MIINAVVGLGDYESPPYFTTTIIVVKVFGILNIFHV